MTFVCLWPPAPTAAASAPERAARLLAAVPRAAADPRGPLWADARGLPAAATAAALLRLADPDGDAGTRAGVSAVAAAAEAAARAGDAPVTRVPRGEERRFLAPLPLAALEPDPALAALLEGVGIDRLGRLAELPADAVEARFGAAGAALRRLARADDPRPLFGPVPPERPHASVSWPDRELRDGGSLVFAVNALLESVCARLRARGEAARRLELRLSLADRSEHRETLGTARPTASREVWLRRARLRLDGLRLPDGVVGIEVEAESAEPVRARQEDLFDPGAATAETRAETLARIVDRFGEIVVVPAPTRHPLPERREGWRPRDLDAPPSLPRPASGAPAAAEPRLGLRLLPEPRPIAVRTDDGGRPRGLRDGREWTTLAAVAGPDRVSGGRWDEPYAREYFRALRPDGTLLLLFRDGLRGGWFLHGWWD